jgi:hypothetical protein
VGLFCACWCCAPGVMSGRAKVNLPVNAGKASTVRDALERLRTLSESSRNATLLMPEILPPLRCADHRSSYLFNSRTRYSASPPVIPLSSLTCISWIFVELYSLTLTLDYPSFFKLQAPSFNTALFLSASFLNGFYSLTVYYFSQFGRSYASTSMYENRVCIPEM